jgi:Ni,Fe-hydrogenase III small subunit
LRLDALRGCFVLVLAITAVPALAFAPSYLGDRAELVGALEEVLPVDIRIPGCPPTLQVIAEHLLVGLEGL